MALKSNKKTEEEELPFPIEQVTETEQTSFEELEWEAEFEDDELPTKFLTISGKEQDYDPTWEKMSMRDLDVGDEFE